MWDRFRSSVNARRASQCFFQPSLKGRALYLSTNEKEVLSLVIAVQKWWPYLLGRPFKVKTDQHLKFLLEQKVATISQQRWISKLLGYDFIIEYKNGKENRVAYALSRKFEHCFEQKELSISLISFLTHTWVEDLKASYLQDPETQTLLLGLQQDHEPPKGFSL